MWTNELLPHRIAWILELDSAAHLADVEGRIGSGGSLKAGLLEEGAKARMSRINRTVQDDAEGAG